MWGVFFRTFQILAKLHAVYITHCVQTNLTAQPRVNAQAQMIARML